MEALDMLPWFFNVEDDSLNSGLTIVKFPNTCDIENGTSPASRCQFYTLDDRADKGEGVVQFFSEEMNNSDTYAITDEHIFFNGVDKVKAVKATILNLLNQDRETLLTENDFILEGMTLR